MTPLPPAIVLAGGFGTRLRSVLPDIPKPLAPICGVPFLRFLLRYLEIQGVSQVILSTGYLANKIEDELGKRQGKLELRYYKEDAPLGTGGAIRGAWEHFNLGQEVLALNGDSLFPIGLERLQVEHRKHNHVGSIIALKNINDAERYGVVSLDDSHRIRAFLTKGSRCNGLINGGVYLLGKAFLDLAPKSVPFSIESDFFVPEAARGNLLGIPFEEDFIDIGIPDDLARAQCLIPHLSKSWIHAND